MTFPAEVLADSPLEYLKLNDTSGTTAVDSSGNSRPGTYTGGYTLGGASALASDPTDHSTAFNGSTAYVSTAYSQFSSGGQRTFEILYNRAVNTADHVLFAAVGGNTMLRMASGGGTIKWFPDTATASSDWASASPGTGQWVHLVLLFNDSGSSVSYNGSTFAGHAAELYINGVSKGRLTGAATEAAAGNGVIGARGTTSEFFNGSLAHFAVYSGLLTPARIAAHYAAAQTAPSQYALIF